MQSELPSARHLIGIKCHLNCEGLQLQEKEPNYHGGSLTPQDHKSYTTNMTEDLTSCEVWGSQKLAASVCLCLPQLVAPQASGVLFQHTTWPWVTLSCDLQYFLWFVIPWYQCSPDRMRGVGGLVSSVSPWITKRFFLQTLKLDWS